jgi:hypothetical protein
MATGQNNFTLKILVCKQESILLKIYMAGSAPAAVLHAPGQRMNA